MGELGAEAKKLSILLVCYGDYPGYSLRAIDSIVRTPKLTEACEVHVACNACCQETVQRARQCLDQGLIASLVESRVNRHKDPMLRQLIELARTPFALFMDDDSHLKEGWLEAMLAFLEHQQPFDVAGKLYWWPRDEQYQAVARKRPWWRGEEHIEVEQREKVMFCTGGLFLARLAFLRQQDWPDRDMLIEYDDALLGDLVHQHGGVMKGFGEELLGRVVINDADRRWDPQALPGAAKPLVPAPAPQPPNRASSAQMVQAGLAVIDSGYAQLTTLADGWYRVIAHNTGGDSAPSAAVRFVSPSTVVPTVTNPAATSQVASEGIEGVSVTLAWTAAADATSYSIYRSTSNSVQSAMCVGNETGTQLVDRQVRAGTQYYYWIQTNREGFQNAPVAVAAVWAVPLAPVDVRAAGGFRSVTITWRPVPGATHYEIYRKSGDAFEAMKTVPATSQATIESTSDDNRLDGAEYTYKVSARNAAGEGTRSDPAASTTAPAAPEVDDEDASFDGTDITVSWSASESAHSYAVYRSVGADGGYGLIATGILGTSYKDHWPQYAKRYYYRIAAVNDAGEGEKSEAVTLATPPTAPTALNWSLVRPVPQWTPAVPQATAAELTWSITDGADGYRVYRLDSQASTSTWVADTTLAKIRTDQFNVPIGALEANVDYLFYVTAVFDDVESPKSRTVVVTVDVPLPPSDIAIGLCDYWPDGGPLLGIAGTPSQDGPRGLGSAEVLVDWPALGQLWRVGAGPGPRVLDFVFIPASVPAGQYTVPIYAVGNGGLSNPVDRTIVVDYSAGAAWRETNWPAHPSLELIEGHAASAASSHDGYAFVNQVMEGFVSRAVGPYDCDVKMQFAFNPSQLSLEGGALGALQPDVWYEMGNVHVTALALGGPYTLTYTAQHSVSDPDTGAKTEQSPVSTSLTMHVVGATVSVNRNVIAVNSGDGDADGIPGWADGYNWDGRPNTADDADPGAASSMASLTVGLQNIGDDAHIYIDRGETEPVGFTRDQSGYHLAWGGMRLWKSANGRSNESARIGGSYIGTGVYTLDELGFTSTGGTLYIEGIGASTYTLKVSVDPDGPGPAAFFDTNSVQVQVISTFADQSLTVAVNDGDGDNDGVVDWADQQLSSGPSGTIGQVTVYLPDDYLPSSTTVRVLQYSASAPFFGTSGGSGSLTNPVWYEPAAGHLRLWTASTSRSAVVEPNGPYVAEGLYSWASLAATPLSRTATLYVEAVRPVRPTDPEDIGLMVLEIDRDGAGPMPAQTMRIHVTAYPVDVDVDSLNDGGGSTLQEDQVENNGRGANYPYPNTATDAAQGITRPGLIVLANNGDTDGDGVPNWADGFDADLRSGTPWSNLDDDDGVSGALGSFPQLSFTIPGNIDLRRAQLEILSYDGWPAYGGSSDPAAIRILSGDGTLSSPYVYSKPAGNLRMWTDPLACAGRSALPFTLRGTDTTTSFYVPPGTYSGSALEALGLVLDADAEQTIRLRIEGIAPSGSLGAQRIGLVLKLETGSNSWTEVARDVVRVTVVGGDLAIDSDNNSSALDSNVNIKAPLPDSAGAGKPDYASGFADELEDLLEDMPGRTGKIIVVNDSDKDDDGVPDFADEYVGSPGGTNDQENLLPVVLKFPALDPVKSDSPARFRLDYPLSNPSEVQSSGGAYTPGDGYLRLWRINGGSRELVQPGAIYTAVGLGWDGNTSKRQVTLYAEAVRPSGIGELRIVAEVDIDGVEGPKDFAAMDAVRLTAVPATAPDAASHAVQLADGSVSFAISDFQAEGFAQVWGQTRVFSSGPLSGVLNAGSVLGAGMSLAEWPRLVQGTSTAIVLIGDEAHYFDYRRGRTGGVDWPEYLPRLGDASALAWSGSTFTYTGPTGDRITFDNAGRFTSFLPAGGSTITAAYNPQGQLVNVSRSGGGVTEAFHYAYKMGGEDDGMLSSVTLKRSRSAGGWEVLRQAEYEYVEQGDRKYLKYVKVSDGQGSILDETYYGWYAPVDGRDRLKFVVDPAGMARYRGAGSQPGSEVNAEAAAAYALYAFTYDDDGRVLSQAVQGAGESSLGDLDGRGVFGYSYAEDDGVGMNQWHFKTTESLPGGAERTVYANYAGLSISDSLSGGGLTQATYAEYDKQGRVKLLAEPSAVAGIDETGQGSLRPGEGIVHVFDRHDAASTATSSVSGTARGQVKEQWLYRGEAGTQRVKEASFLYRLDGTRPYLYEQTSWINGENGDGLITLYNPQGLRVKNQWPVVSAEQNGPGGQQRPEESWSYDGLGRVTSYTDASGRSISNVYDTVTGGLRISTVGGEQTIHELDAFGRPVLTTDPMGTKTVTAYVDSYGRSVATTRILWTDTTTTAPPVQEVVVDRTRGWVDVRTISYSGARTLSLERQVLDWAGRAVAVDRFQSINGVSYESIDTVAEASSKKIIDDTQANPLQANFYRTEYRYNPAGLADWTKNAVGTITQVVYDGLGRATETKVGVADGSLTLISVNAYDPTSGNLSSVTLYPGGSEDPRVTKYWHDWRGRLVASKEGAEGSQGEDVNRPLTVYELNEMGQATSISIYDGDGWEPSIGGDGLLSGLVSGMLRARTEQRRDAQGRVYESIVNDVNQSTGAFVEGQGLKTSFWYDKAGRVIKQREPGGLVTKTAYDSAGRMIDTWLTDGGGDSSWTDAGNVSGDTILERVHLDLDLNGNVLVSRLEQRQPNGTLRISRTQNWYDRAGRLESSADLGTLGGTYASPVAALNAGALLSGHAYDAAGNVQTVNDPGGVVTRMWHDALGRVTTRVEAEGGQGGDRKTSYQYTGLDQVRLLTTDNIKPGAADQPGPVETQTVEYLYGVEKGDSSAVSSNDLLRVVEYPGYPNPSVQASSETFEYNALDETVRMRERSGVWHLYTRDVAGRTISDFVYNIPSNMDKTVEKLSFGFDALGRLVRATSEGKNGSGAWGNVNEVKREYNGYGQLVREFQEHNGSVITSGPTASYHVDYVYDSSSGDSRLQRLAWQDGRQLWYGYNTGLDASIGRVSWIAEGTPTAAGAHLEDYTYLGLGTIWQRNRPSSQPSQSIALDPFGRIEQITWGSVDGYGYGYDASGNLLYRENLTRADLSQQYTHNALGQQLTWAQGVLGGNKTITQPASIVSWKVDSQGNRYGGRYGEAYELNIPAQEQTANSLGGLTMNIPLHNGGTKQLTAKYDAWGRLTRADAAGTDGSVQAHPRTYAYDALGRRIASWDAASSLGTMHSYYDGGLVIEERNGAGAILTQHVWSPDGRPVLRDRDADAFVVAGLDPATGQQRTPQPGLDERLWVLYDGQGSVTAVVKNDGTVAERYVYDQDGRATALEGRVTAVAEDWTEWPDAYPSITGLPNRVSSHYGWEFLYRGMRWQPVITNSASGLQGLLPWGLYEAGGGQFYDANNGRMVQPDIGAYAEARNAYDPGLNWSGGLATAIQIGSWAVPIVGLAVNWFAASYERHLDGADNVFIGGFGDMTGLSDVFNGLSSGDWGEAAWGVAQAGLMGFGMARPMGALRNVAALQRGPAVGSLLSQVPMGVWKAGGIVAAAGVGTGMFGTTQEAEAFPVRAAASAGRTIIGRVRALNAKGISGIDSLVGMMTRRNMNVWRGAYFQAKRALDYRRAGLLSKVEFELAGGHAGDILLTNGLAVETKSWLRWNGRLSSRVRAIRLRRLERQVERYMRTPEVARLRLEFERRIPAQVSRRLVRLQLKYGDRLEWKVI